MVDHPIPMDTRKRRSARAAVLVTLLALALLGWEAVAKPASPPPARGRHRSSARVRPQPPPAATATPAKMVPSIPAPPPAPPPRPAPVDPATLCVDDILIDPADPAARFAVIDGVAVRVGETIGGHPVRAVLPDRVLIGEESEFVLLPHAKDR